MDKDDNPIFPRVLKQALENLLSSSFQEINRSDEIFYILSLFDSDNDLEQSLYKELSGTELTKVTNFEEIVTKFTQQQFKQNFRLERTTYEATVNILTSDKELLDAFFPHEARMISADNGGPVFSHSGKKPIRLQTAVLTCLWYLANPDSMRTNGLVFGIARSTVFQCLHKISLMLCVLKDKFIVWPKTTADLTRCENAFKDRAGFPGVIGAVDGCHIEIICPPEHHKSYTNRKCDLSMNLHAIVSAEKMFLDIFVGFPGSVHDARVFRNSPFYKTVLDAHASLFPHEKYHLLGDSAYPLRKWILTPFRDTGRLTAQEKKFNYVHSATRIAVEHVFGMLKSRWRVLQLLQVKLEFMPYLITACCVLHNICETESDLLEDWYLEETRDDSEESGDDGSSGPTGNSTAAMQEGASKRNEIMRRIC